MEARDACAEHKRDHGEVEQRDARVEARAALRASGEDAGKHEDDEERGNVELEERLRAEGHAEEVGVGAEKGAGVGGEGARDGGRAEGVLEQQI